MPSRVDGTIWYSCLERTCYETDWRFWRWSEEIHEFVYRFPERRLA
jgi:hypothetical protein